MAMKEDKINIEFVKKIMTEKKTTLPSLRNQDWKKIKIEIEKVNKSLPNIPTSNITELNELIYTSKKLVYNEIGAPPESEQKCKTWIGNKYRRS